MGAIFSRDFIPVFTFIRLRNFFDTEPCNFIFVIKRIKKCDLFSRFTFYFLINSNILYFFLHYTFVVVII